MKSLPIALSNWSQVSSSITLQTACCLWPLCPPCHLLCHQFSLVDFYVRSPRSGSGFSDGYFLHHEFFPLLLSGQFANAFSDSLQQHLTSSTPGFVSSCCLFNLLSAQPRAATHWPLCCFLSSQLSFYLLSSSSTPSCKCMFIYLSIVSPPVRSSMRASAHLLYLETGFQFWHSDRLTVGAQSLFAE